jgi:hypothetical protein
MTEKQFDDLTNLYLDHEIGRQDLRELKEAIHHNVLRRRKFERACEIHQAARKALLSQAGEATGGQAPGGGAGAAASFIPVARTSSSAVPGLHRGRAGRRAESGPGSIKQKQSQAHRNASVVTLAERQLNKGAASEVDLAKINLESHRGPEVAGGGRHIFSFFDSPVGLMIGGLLLVLGGAVLFFTLKFTTPDENDDGTVKNPALHQSDVVIDPKVLRELSADQKNKPPADDAAHARNYQAALRGQSAANTPPANDYASAANASSASSAPAGPTVASLTLPASSAVPPPPSLNSGEGNVSPQVLLSAPGAGALAPSQDAWVQLSMPSSLPPTPSLDDKNPPANQTTMPVMLP